MDKDDFNGALVQAGRLNKTAPDEIVGYRLMAAADRYDVKELL